jgi:hypothetical protein
VAAAVLASRAPAGVQLVDGNGVPYAWDLDAPGQPNVKGGAVTFYVDPRGTSDTVRGSKSAADAVRDGVQAWAVGTTRIRFVEDATRPASGRNGTDRVNWIGWTTTGLSPLTYAATYPTRNGSQIVDMDVVLNDRDFAWDTRTPGLGGVADIQSLVAHEWGHAVGADHVPLRLSTMYYSADTGATSLRSLAADDVALVGSMYPNDAFRGTTATIRGRVTVGGTSDDRAVHVVAVSVATAEPAASTLSAPDGSYVLAGLPRGAYRVVAAPALPLADVMNAWWRSGSTSFLPAVAGVGGTNPVRARTLALAAADEAEIASFGVAPVSAPLEPNDSPAQATPLSLGEAACGRFETASDHDWFAFDALAGQRITVSVLAWELGSTADPQLRLTDAEGNVVQGGSVIDIRGGAFATQPQGSDRDARIVGWTVPASGRYAVRVATDNAVSGTNSWYVLFTTVASDSPSAILTTAGATPGRIDAGGTATTTLVVRPLREDGEPVGAGAAVEIAHSGSGTVGAVTYDAADGTYRAAVTAAATPGRDVFSVVVTSAGGTATVQDAATVVYVGPADPGRTTFRAEPRRIAVDGSATSLVHFVPRDASGEELGTGRAASFSMTPDLGGSIDGAVTDLGDGEYVATLRSGTAPGRATLIAAVDAQAAVATATVAFGFDLADVLDMASGDVAAFRATPGLPRKAATALARAGSRLASALAAANDVAGGTKSRTAALARARAALPEITVALARASSQVADPGTAREIALALHEAAQAARTTARVVTARDQSRIDLADRLLLRGHDALADGNVVGAADRWLRAYRAVLPLQ